MRRASYVEHYRYSSIFYFSLILASQKNSLKIDSMEFSIAYGLFGEANGKVEIAPSANPVVYGFTGHMVDLESGLNRTEFRQYHQGVGRWLTQEPKGKDGFNYYHYVLNNPVRNFDYNGLSTRGGQLAAGVLILAGVANFAHLSENASAKDKRAVLGVSAVLIGSGIGVGIYDTLFNDESYGPATLEQEQSLNELQNTYDRLNRQVNGSACEYPGA